MDDNTSGFMKFINPQCQEEDCCIRNNLFQEDSKCIKQQPDLLSEQAAPFPILEDQCPALNLDRSNNDLLLQNDISLPKGSDLQAIQLTPSSGDYSTYVMADNNNNDNDSYSNINYSSKNSGISPSSRTPSVAHNENVPDDSKAKKRLKTEPPKKPSEREKKPE